MVVGGPGCRGINGALINDAGKSKEGCEYQRLAIHTGGDYAMTMVDHARYEALISI